LLRGIELGSTTVPSTGRPTASWRQQCSEVSGSSRKALEVFIDALAFAL
jgi:hypothetical protein